MPVVTYSITALTTARSVNVRGRPYRLLLVLDVGANRRKDEHAVDVDASADAVHAGETLPQAVRELQRGHEQGAGTGNAMRNQPPPHLP